MQITLDLDDMMPSALVKLAAALAENADLCDSRVTAMRHAMLLSKVTYELRLHGIASDMIPTMPMIE